MDKEKIKKAGGIGIKLIFITLIIIALLIGLSFIKNQLWEREHTYDCAKEEIALSAGGLLSFEGPYLAIPYTKTTEEFVYRDNHQFKEESTSEGWELVSADNINIEADIDTEERYLGIYSTPIFTGSASIYASFDKAKIEDQKNIVYHPEESIIFIKIPNTSLLAAPDYKINGKEYKTELVCINNNWGIGSKYNYDSEKTTITTKLGLRGANKFQYYISSKETKLSVKSDWKSPGFTNFSYLPDKRNLDDKGFTAQWSIPFGSNEINSKIGFSLIDPVNLYQKLHRAIKYGFLFIIVPFLLLFLFEIFAKITLHPVHYLLCGAACVLFFLLLLAASEHISFDLSYLTAALIAALTVSLYISSVTKRFALGCIISGMFTVLYTYLFFSLKSEDYALLLGAFFAFGILALIMFITRKVDWYNLKKKENKDNKEDKAGKVTLNERQSSGSSLITPEV